MKHVLWISRHNLTAQQTKGLEAFCGGPFCLEQWQDTVEQPELLRPAIARADVIAAVLPVHLLAALVELAGDKPVLVDIAQRTLLPGIQEPDVAFSHGGWQRVAQLELKLVPAQKP